jgi:iron(III) transport system permease protein
VRISSPIFQLPTFSPLIHTLYVATVTALWSVTLAFGYAYAVCRTDMPLRSFFRHVVFLPLFAPTMMHGIGMVYLFGNKGLLTALGLRVGLYGSAAILVLANVVHFLSVAFLTATTALRKLDDEFEQVGESLGVPFYRIFTAVTVPMCLPAIFEIALYFFVNAMVTISAVVFLYPPGFKLASVAIVNMTDAGDIAPAAAMSVLIVLTNIAVRAVFEGVTGSFRRRTAVWMRSEGV